MTTLTTYLTNLPNLMLVSLSGMPWFVNALLNLLHALVLILIAISGGVAVVVLIIDLIKWYTADQNEKPAEAKKIRGVLIGAALVIIAESGIAWVLSFFTV